MVNSLKINADPSDLTLRYVRHGRTKFVNENSSHTGQRAVQAGREVRHRARKRVAVDDLPVKLARVAVLVAELLPTWSGYRGQGRTHQWRDRVLLVASWIVTRQHANVLPYPLAREPLAAMIGLNPKTIERVVDCLVEIGIILRTTPIAVRRGPILIGLTPGASRVWYLPHQYIFSARVRSILDGQDVAPAEGESGTAVATSNSENPTDQEETPNVIGYSSTIPPIQQPGKEDLQTSGFLVGCNFNLASDRYAEHDRIRARARRLIARRPMPGDYTPRPPYYRGAEAEWQAHEIAEAYQILEDLDRRRSMS